jgi:hypothetical protein
MIAQLDEAGKDSDRLTRDKRAELRGVISAKPGPNWYLHVTPGGLVRAHTAKAKPRRTPTSSTRSGPQTRTCQPETLASAAGSARSRARMARPHAGHRPAPRPSPQGGTHPRPCDPMVAGTPPRPHRPERPQRRLPSLRRESDTIHGGTFTGPVGTFQQRTKTTKSQLGAPGLCQKSWDWLLVSEGLANLATGPLDLFDIFGPRIAEPSGRDRDGDRAGYFAVR